MSEHTPGPWHYNAVNEGVLGKPESMKPAGFSITAAEPKMFGGTRVIESGIRCEANAKLIAASPKLAAALVGMLRAYGNCGSPLQQAAADAADEALRDAGVPRT